MSARRPHPQTLFHLLPVNENAKAFLSHPDNNQFISECNQEGTPIEYGFEVGYHVPMTPRAHVVCEIGRNADLIFNDPSISGRHLSIEVHPESKVILIYDRSRHHTTNVYPTEFRSGFSQVVLVPHSRYEIVLNNGGSKEFRFEIRWNRNEHFSAQVKQEYKTTLQRHQNPRLARTIEDYTEVPTFHHTHLQTPTAGVERAIKVGAIGNGAFGEVSKAVDIDTGDYVAVKTIRVPINTENRERLMALLKREISTMSSLCHAHILECLGWKEEFNKMHIYTSLRAGSVNDLIRAQPSLREDFTLVAQLTKEMLAALDYLAVRNLCHRDVKPDNILYMETQGKTYKFQLADFGLAKHQEFASTVCGTPLFMAPEVALDGGILQTPKLDVWSLFVTVMTIIGDVKIPTNTARAAQFSTTIYQQVLAQVEKAAQKHPNFSAMARKDPTLRASAAQMLMLLFGGECLTTDRKDVPAIPPEHREKEPPEGIQTHSVDICLMDRQEGAHQLKKPVSNPLKRRASKELHRVFAVISKVQSAPPAGASVDEEEL